MKYDDIYEHTGHMGRLQWLVFIGACSLSVFCMEPVNLIFVGGPMDHWCRVDELAHLPYDRQKHMAIPQSFEGEESDGLDTDDAGFSKCSMYAVNWTTFSEVELATWNRTVHSFPISNDSCKSWVYDQSQYTSTIFDLVCGRKFLVELVTSIYMIGVLLGSVTCGVFSDRFGRKIALIVVVVVKTIGAAISIFANDYVTFVIGRLICGYGLSGCFLIAFVLLMETVGPKYKTFAGIAVQMGLSCGYMMNAAVAYFIRNDFFLQLVTMGPIALFIPLAFIVPESVRWLVVQARYDEAQRVLRRISAINGTTLPDYVDLRLLENETPSASKNCTALFTSHEMRRRTLITYFSWFSVALVYFAQSLFSTHLTSSASVYVSTLVSGAIEIPATLAALILVDRETFGRRGSGCLSFIVAGVASFLCALSAMFGWDVATMVMLLAGKAFITMAYSVAYLFGSEIFPTEVRNVGIGTSSMMECAGGFVAPIIAGPLTRWWTPLPSIIYGALASLSGVLYLLLPETLGQPLFNTIEDAERLQKSQESRCCCWSSKAEQQTTGSESDKSPPDNCDALSKDDEREHSEQDQLQQSSVDDSDVRTTDGPLDLHRTAFRSSF